MKEIVEYLPYFLLLGWFIFSVYYLLLAKNKPEKINPYIFESIPQIFPTIGILGTFIGIAYGLWSFNENKIEESIPPLIGGLKTAFLASIGGIVLSIIFSKFTAYKQWKNEKGKLSDETIALNKLVALTEELKINFHDSFTYTDENNNKIKPANVFRDIYKELAKQSNALQTFSSDLALTISAGFEQILNNPTEGVVAELKLVKAEIESLGNKLKDPATDMTQSIVKELQESMGKMIEEFKTSMSGDTKNEMEHLAKLLGQAGGSLTDFPTKLQNMTDNLNENFRGLQDVVQQISQQTLSQSQDSTNAMKRQVEDMSEILRTKVGDLQSGQQSLLTEQSKNLQVSENLLSAFNTSIENMNGLSVGVTQSINKLNEAQSALASTISNFRNASQEINSSSTKFGESQLTFSRYSNEFLQTNSNTIDEIQKSLVKAKDVSADYAQKFEIIEKGLQGIFLQIQNGLEQYKSAVGNGLETILGEYTQNLMKATESLASATELQSESIKDLEEEIKRVKS
jgi:methyl-accepting chemotaxis protein